MCAGCKRQGRGTPQARDVLFERVVLLRQNISLNGVVWSALRDLKVGRKVRTIYDIPFFGGVPLVA